MKLKMYIIVFLMYLLITSNLVYILHYNLYSITTSNNFNNNKVCLVLVDGLRYDTVSKMPFLNYISKTENSILYEAYSGIPSNSRPGYERIFTGTSTSINGINSNKMHVLSLTPNIFYLTHKENIKVSVCGYYWLKELYSLNVSHSYYYYKNDEKIFEKAVNYINFYRPNLIVIHPMSVDNAGHKYGGASYEYIQSAKDIDNKIRDIWSLLSKFGYTLIVTSDHGHLDEGGHGDSSIKSTQVPLAIISDNLQQLYPAKNNDQKSLTDIAPTICDILGIPKTIFMTGNSLIKHDNQIHLVRTHYSLFEFKNFEKFFSLSFNISQTLLSILTVINIASCFVVIKLLKD